MQDIYDYIPKANRFYRVIVLQLFYGTCDIYSVECFVLLHRSRWAVPSMAVFCSSLIPCLPGMLLRYFLNNFEMVPFAPVSSCNTFAFIFHIFSFFLLSTFMTPEISTSVRTHAPFPLSRIMSSLLLLLLLLLLLSSSSSSSYLYEHLNLVFNECDLIVFDKESGLN